MSGPSDHSSPHHFSASSTFVSNSGVERVASVSSMRRMKLAAVLLGEKIVEQSDVGGADMRLAGGGGAMRTRTGAFVSEVLIFSRPGRTAVKPSAGGFPRDRRHAA